MEKDKKEMANYLWLEINKAIVNSQNVKNCLHLMAEMDMIDFLLLFAQERSETGTKINA